MAPINQGKLDVWIYKFLLGTLGKEKTKLLKEELERRGKENRIFSAIEQKLLAAFTVDRPVRKYLGELLDDWEKRNWGS
ncbi:MAG: hypothetical protein A3G51_00375 [Candidatus Yanofskybacteria bacterium RIFCSPLOWO2_12_FULL_43_11b]|uniref:Uncharacterized protein n=1 Tax=Candidatus Yanofskybacteria bacterium RIFCSPLOWO2_12_FULL_43_11b TaxID=1802710 RepID=A0A1F8H9V8_9BACT|nr:MAG: hypothetical protein A2742_02260 [Candidatus Yanofskybacteria bacterium RIFCSPHIGHO2_01_FULL_43_32]OGN18399.1 MAG: hypothetical protein A3E34_00930 [Candidatus Yanofskybacteria bacterium RIFCSPHIGHO2_12_FULL_43_11]OGN24856.1 MAG: hypothetical protein A2923_01080 [Candidatus Yanofskybacteria bacterium RIFCSPLOWO2_01_FULL_43_46]OGN34354.1 MAG: hypothetical protein A3G51_00375 [Candidatus Yanofskybacteria bacterium RIFCSPLOWO2_12_FULL_43_11b]